MNLGAQSTHKGRLNSDNGDQERNRKVFITVSRQRGAVYSHPLVQAQMGLKRGSEQSMGAGVAKEEKTRQKGSTVSQPHLSTILTSLHPLQGSRLS